MDLYGLGGRELSLLREKFSGDELDAAARRVAGGEPLGYVLGEWYFMNETYEVGPDCLIPRPETEHLVEKLVSLCPENGVFADLCTGSGCVAVSALVMRPDLTAVAYDVSEKALEIAERNAEKNGVSGRIRFVRADLMKEEPAGYFDVIAANPPYIPTEVINGLSEEVRREPRLALDGGPDGLAFYRRFDAVLPRRLRPGGALVFEIGYDEGDALRGMGYTVTKDYSGNDRVAVKIPDASLRMETERLIIDRVRESDKEDYFTNISHDKKVLETFICRYAETLDEFDFSAYPGNARIFAIRLRETGRLIGILTFFDDTAESCEIGYGLGSRYWNAGYATEAVRRFIRYLFGERGLRTVYASFFTGNEASRRVMEKCGMTFCRFSEKELTYLGVERDLTYYSLDNPEADPR
ncbi:MAG: peptide chain release factor N(5)-glutamine methyltransferase [Clostridia bacterium]|nr:peptide chain release factor N(5)-glutamine methyltransferase [Clostridia bacterium]